MSLLHSASWRAGRQKYLPSLRKVPSPPLIDSSAMDRPQLKPSVPEKLPSKLKTQVEERDTAPLAGVTMWDKDRIPLPKIYRLSSIVFVHVRYLCRLSAS